MKILKNNVFIVVFKVLTFKMFDCDMIMQQLEENLILIAGIFPSHFHDTE